MAEYVIVGGGVYGAGVAYWLAKQGADVHLLEAKQIGNGASAGPGRRGTRANGRDMRELPLVRLAHEMWPSLHEELGVELFFERLGHLLLIEREADLELCKARALLQNQHGTETQFLDGQAAREREPHVSKNVIAALHGPLDGATDHTAATDAFAHAAQRAGATISTNVRAASIEYAGGKANAIITTDGQRIDATRGVILLASTGIQSLLAERIQLPIWSRTFQVILTNELGTQPIRHLIGHASRTLAVKAEAGNRVMISGGLPGVWDEQTETGTAVQSAIEANFADAVSVFPILGDATVEIADADHLETLSIDSIPVIDQVPGTTNAIYATAWCGHGWAIAPPITQMLAEWAISGTKPKLLHPFTHERFHA